MDTVNTPNSSVIKSISYTAIVGEVKYVDVEFRNGSTYQYVVPRKRAFHNFVNSPSIGRYFNSIFKTKYGPGIQIL
jgi:hypothetical protein